MRLTQTKISRPRRSVRACLLTLVIWTTTAAPVEPAAEIVVNHSVKPQILSVTTVRAIFGMRLRNWPDGEPIQVFVLYDQRPLHAIFCKQVLNMFPHQLRLAWDRLVFSGTGQAPYEVHSEEEMRARVATTPGAIGYVGEAMLDASVRVPKIDH